MVRISELTTKVLRLAGRRLDVEAFDVAVTRGRPSGIQPAARDRLRRAILDADRKVARVRRELQEAAWDLAHPRSAKQRKQATETYRAQLQDTKIAVRRAADTLALRGRSTSGLPGDDKLREALENLVDAAGAVYQTIHRARPRLALRGVHQPTIRGYTLDHHTINADRQTGDLDVAGEITAQTYRQENVRGKPDLHLATCPVCGTTVGVTPGARATCTSGHGFRASLKVLDPLVAEDGDLAGRVDRRR